MTLPSHPAPVVVNHKGRTIHLRADDDRGAALAVAGGALTPASLRIWQQLLDERPWDLVVDVGANYGELLLGADIPAGARVVAFEPEPTIRGCLERSVVAAGLSIEIRPEALADREGTLRFLADDRWSGTSRLAFGDEDSGPLREAVVQGTTLDLVFNDTAARSACIKIDVEGAEDLVLAGGAGLFRRLDRLAIVVEILHRSTEQVAQWAAAWRLYLSDVRSGQLVRVRPDEPDHVRHLLQQPWIYGQDAVLRPLRERG